LRQVGTNNDSLDISTYESLNGYFEKDGTLGKLQLSGFKLSIKGLNNNFVQTIDFTIGEWQAMINLIASGERADTINRLLGNFVTSSK
jgi:hypothetical protein